jgi:hypothetical protein
LGVGQATEPNRFSGFHSAKPLKRLSGQALLITQLKLGVNEKPDQLQERDAPAEIPREFFDLNTA